MKYKIAPFSVIVAGCLWGSVGMFIRYLGEQGLNNLTIVESRMSLSAIILLICLLIFNRKLLKVKLKDAWVFICAGVSSSLILNYFYNVAVNELSLSLAAILLATMPVFVILISAVLFKEKITLLKIVSMILVFVGCVFVSGIFESTEAKVSAIGIIFGLLAGFGYALYSVFSKIALNKGYHSLTIVTYSFIVSGIVLAPFCNWGTIGSVLSGSHFRMVGVFLLQSLLCAVIPYGLYNFSLSYIDAGVASILASCEPVAATVFGLILYNEVPSVIAIIGLVIVIAALALISRPVKVRSKGLKVKSK